MFLNKLAYFGDDGAYLCLTTDNYETVHIRDESEFGWDALKHVYDKLTTLVIRFIKLKEIVNWNFKPHYDILVLNKQTCVCEKLVTFDSQDA